MTQFLRSENYKYYYRITGPWFDADFSFQYKVFCLRNNGSVLFEEYWADQESYYTIIADLTEINEDEFIMATIR